MRVKVEMVSTVFAVGLAALLAVQHRSLVRLRADQAELRQSAVQQKAAAEALQEKNERLPETSTDAAGVVRLRAQELELLRLRGEVGRLREQVQAMERQSNSASPTSMAGDDVLVIPPEQVVTVLSMNPPNPLSLRMGVRELAEVGTTSIESAAQTALWAVLNRNDAGFGRIRYADTNAPQLSAAQQANYLRRIAQGFDGAQEVMIDAAQANGENRQWVYFRTRWPNDEQAVDKPAGGTLVFQRTDSGWQLDQLIIQGRPHP